MHRKRVIIALILVPLLYLYITYLPVEFFLYLLIFFSTVALIEFYAMFRVQGVLKYAGLLFGAMLLAVFFDQAGRFPDVLLTAVLITTSLRLLIKKDPSSSLSDVSSVVLGLLYIPGLLTFQLSLVKAGPEWIMMLYASVWAADSMAYYVGKSIGKRKLYEEISPNKTVAGAVGSVFGGIAGALIMRLLVLPEISLFLTALGGAIIGIATILGDLVESMFKRDAGVKDSGRILPGHGGVLDKIDGVTFAGPLFFWFCTSLEMIR